MKFAPPSLFSAFACTATGDADLPDGVHLRLSLSPDLGPPIAPFAIWQTQIHPQAMFTGAGPLSLPVDATATDTNRIVAIAAADPGNLPKALVLSDPLGGEIARRSAGPWQVAAPIVQAARIDGGSAATQFGLCSVAADGFGNFLNTRPNFLLPLPIGGQCLWYAGGAADQGGAQAQGKSRLTRGAPKRQTPVDAPGSAPAALTPDKEVARVQWQSEIEARLELLLRQDAATPPAVRKQTIVDNSNPNKPTAEIGIWDSLLIQTADIGYARYAGLATTFDATLPPFPPGGSVGRTILPGFWIAGLFALTSDALVDTIPDPNGGPPLQVAKHLFPVDASEQQLLAGFRAVTPGLDAVLARAKAAGLQVRPVLTFCAAPVPADPPRAGNIGLAGAKWIAQKDKQSTTFRQSFTFAGQPLAATMAMAANTGPGGSFVPRTAPVDKAPGRFSPLLVGRLDDGTVTASDGNVPLPAPTYHFHAGDLFGRYGGASTIAAKAPDVPKPPAPVPQTLVTRAILPAGAMQALSPGKLSVTVPVPGIGALAAGALPIASLGWSFAGAGGTVTIPAGPGPAPVAFEVPLPPLLPLASGSWDLQVTFSDGVTASAPAVSAIAVTDSRAPQPIKAGTGIIWTSRPGPAPEVELNLRWQAAAGQGYRCYLATGATVGAAGKTRADAALAADPAKVAAREGYQLLTEMPLAAGADGIVHVSTTLPRALRDVAFVKVVAVSADGVEADFAASGVVPIAVPRDLPPPPPRVFAVVNASGTGAAVTITATGIDLVALQAAESGLFTSPVKAGAHPPTARLKRATGPVNDPLYARPVAGPLPLVRQADGTFAVEIPQDPAHPLVPFVRCTWWADVRLPDERRLPSDAQALAGAILPDGGTGGDMPGLPSSLSAPFTTVPVPADAPQALPASAIQAGISPAGAIPNGRVAYVTITGAPVAHPAAVGSWQLKVWAQVGDQPIALVVDQPTTTAPFTWAGTPMQPAVPVRFTVMLVDPIGREGAPAQVTATP